MAGSAPKVACTIKHFAKILNDAPANESLKDAMHGLNMPVADATNAAGIALAVYQAALNGNIQAVEKWEKLVGQDEKSGSDDGSAALAFDFAAHISPAFFGPHRAVLGGSINELVAKGGRGSTKSSYISLELLNLLNRNPDVNAVVMRRVANTLRASVYSQIQWAIAETGRQADWKCTVSPMECVNQKTGQKIMFFGMDDPGKLKSIKVSQGYIGIAWFEELDQFDGPEQIRNVEQSLFRGGAFSFSFKSFNPPAMARSWANKYALEAKAGKLVHHSTYETTPPEWLGPRFLDDARHLQEVNETAYRHEYLGEVVGSGTEVFENLEIRQITDDEIAGFDRITSGVDWGWYPDPWAFNRMHYDAARKTLYLFDELTRNRTSNRETADLLLARIPPDELVTADSAEPKSCSDYRSFGIRCREARKGPGSVEYSMKWLQSLDKIVIDPVRCPDTAAEFTEYEYERDPRTDEVLQGYPDINNHHIDAVRYGMNSVWTRRGQ